MSERKNTSIAIHPNCIIYLHESELFYYRDPENFGDRYQFNLVLDNRINFRFGVEQARKLQQALTDLLARVEE